MKAIFIGGADRSGTTLLASLLSCINNSVVTPESLFKTELLFPMPIDTASYCQKLKVNKKFKEWHINLEEIRNLKHENYLDFYCDLVTLFNGNDKVDFWIDHTPNNLRYSKILNDNFKDCFFIHIVRDGRAVANSQIPLEWGPNTYLSAAKDWLNKLSYGFATEVLFPHKTIFIKYEDLVCNEKLVLEKILNFLNIKEYKQAYVADASFLPNFTKNQHSLVGKSPDKSRVNDWKNKLNTQNICDYQYYAQDMLNLLDYEIIDTGIKKVTKIHLLSNLFIELWFKKIANPRIYNRNRK